MHISSAKRIFAFVHLWVGLGLGIPLVLLGLTGSVLVFEHELDRWTHPELHRAGNLSMRPVADILAAARAVAPERHEPVAVTLPEEAGEPAIVRLAAGGRAGPGAPAVQVFVDPGSLDVLGTRDPMSTLLRQVFLLHANLMIRGDRSGREMIGWLGVVMLGLGLTGLYLWWPRNGRWRAAFTVKQGAGTYRINRDLHGAVGIWGVAVLVAVSFSGVYLAFPAPLQGAITTFFPARDLRAVANALRARPKAGVKPIEVDEAIAMARASVPGAEPRRVFLPGRPDQPMRVGLEREGSWSGAPLVNVAIDPFEPKVLDIQDPKTFTGAELVMAYQHALHEGGGFGPVWRGLVFVSGLLPTLFAVTGLTMWLTKRRRRRAATQETGASVAAALNT